MNPCPTYRHNILFCNITAIRNIAHCGFNVSLTCAIVVELGPTSKLWFTGGNRLLSRRPSTWSCNGYTDIFHHTWNHQTFNYTNTLWSWCHLYSYSEHMYASINDLTKHCLQSVWARSEIFTVYIEYIPIRMICLIYIPDMVLIILMDLGLLHLKILL